MFSGLFAAYAVLADHTAGGPDGLKLFDRGYVLLETACLLFSSFTCGLCALAIERRSRAADLPVGRRHLPPRRRLPRPRAQGVHCA